MVRYLANLRVRQAVLHMVPMMMMMITRCQWRPVVRLQVVLPRQVHSVSQGRPVCEDEVTSLEQHKVRRTGVLTCGTTGTMPAVLRMSTSRSLFLPRSREMLEK